MRRAWQAEGPGSLLRGQSGACEVDCAVTDRCTAHQCLPMLQAGVIARATIAPRLLHSNKRIQGG